MRGGFLILIFIFIAEAFFSSAIYGQRKILIQNIFISGNKETNDEVILREIPFKTGDSLYIGELKNALERAHSTLLNTSLFLTVDIYDSVYADSTLADIKINLRERWYIIPAFEFLLEDRNFNEWWRHKQLYRTTLIAGVTHFNFRGRNERLGLDLSIGWRQTAVLKYKIPYLNKNKTLGLGLSLFYTRGHEVGHLTKNNRLEFLRVNDRFIYQRTGFESALYYRRQHKVTHTVKFGFNHYKIDDTISKFTNPEFLGAGRNTLDIPNLGYGFTYDNRSSAFYTDNGNYFWFYVEQAGLPHISSPLKMLWAEAQYRNYFSPAKNLIVSSGILARINSLDSLPYIYRNSLGYRHQVRGYEHYVSDGNALVYIANELRYKTFETKIKIPYMPFEQFNTIPLAVYFKVYMDNGYVNNPAPKANNTLVNTWLNGYGAGLDIVSYYDKIFRLEYSFNDLRQSELFLHYVEVF